VLEIVFAIRAAVAPAKFVPHALLDVGMEDPESAARATVALLASCGDCR
jgi:hypothetical protein